jgi:transposase
MKSTYLSAKYHSLVGRRGKKRALVAVGHKILVMAYHMIKNGVPYKELGKDYLLHRREDKIVKNHIKRLRDLGYEVELKKAA